MKLLIITLALTAVSALAQVPKSQGYVYQGFGSGFWVESPGVGSTGVGGQGSFFKGLGAGAEIGAAYPLQYPRGVVGKFSTSGYYNFTAGRKDLKWDPFVVAGYTLLFRSGSANLGHFGGGVTYWFKPKYGLRLEVRNHCFGRCEENYTEFRVGFSFH